MIVEFILDKNSHCFDFPDPGPPMTNKTDGFTPGNFKSLSMSISSQLTLI